MWNFVSRIFATPKSIDKAMDAVIATGDKIWFTEEEKAENANPSYTHDTAIRDMLRMALEIDGFACIEAGNTYDAHCLILDERPDIVLLDWMLPGGSGIELLRRLKREDNTRDVPVIMHTLS